MTSQSTALLCLPFAGAGASVFQPWQAEADTILTVLPVQLPGREKRFVEEPYRDVHTAVAGLLEEVLDLLDGRESVALFGHSLGAMLAYELAYRFGQVGGLRIEHLFASGSPAPTAPRAERATGLGDDEFVARVAEFAGYTHSALRNPEMRELLLPCLRADVEMHESYVSDSDKVLDVPITALRGSDDELVGAAEVAGWAGSTSAAFAVAELSGGHMYLTDSPAPLLRLIAATIADG